MRRWLGPPSPATVISVIALFVALGGAGYAATTIASKQIADNSVASRDIRDGTILPRDLNPKAVRSLRGRAGPAGPRGPAGAPGATGAAGAPATSMFGYVRVKGGDTVELAYGEGIVKAEQVPVTSVPGRVDVTFERDLRGCVVQATPGTGRPRGDSDALLDVRIGVLVDPDDAEGVLDNVARVFTFAGAINNTVDASFTIAAFC